MTCVPGAFAMGVILRPVRSYNLLLLLLTDRCLLNNSCRNWRRLPRFLALLECRFSNQIQLYRRRLAVVFLRVLQQRDLPTLRLFRPTILYVSRKMPPIRFCPLMHPISTNEALYRPVCCTLKSEKPFGVQHKSTTDSSKQDLITHTGLDRFVLQIVSFLYLDHINHCGAFLASVKHIPCSHFLPLQFFGLNNPVKTTHTTGPL